MRKTLEIIGVIVAVLVVIVAGLFTYATLNLNSIIKANQAYLLARVSDSLGRQVQAQKIEVSLGWGIGLRVTSVQIADDPSFSQLPFVEAGEVSGEVAFLPLLARELDITRLVFLNPSIRVLRDSAGQLNVSTLGKGKGAQPGASGTSAPAEAGGRTQGLTAEAPSKSAGGGGGLQNLAISNLSVRGGQLLYQDASQPGAPLGLEQTDLDVEGFSADAPFKVSLKLSFFSEGQNLKISGKLGPLMEGGAIDVNRVPLALKIVLGPLMLDRLRTLAPLHSKIPAKLSMPDPVILEVKLNGTPERLGFNLNTDLSAARVLYLGQFNKPAGMPLRVTASGARGGGAVTLSSATLTLADMQLKASDIAFGAGELRARIDSNSFALEPLAKTAAAMAKYAVSGRSEVHCQVQAAQGGGGGSSKTPEINGTLAFIGVGIKAEESKLPGLSGINSTIHLAGNSAVVDPTTFTTGSSHGTLQARAESLQPLRATYILKADDIKPSQFVPSRPPEEEIRALSLSGSAGQSAGALDVTAQLSSAAGMVANVPYQNLALSAEYGNQRVSVRSLKLNAYGGAVAATADSTLGEQPAFTATLNAGSVDLEQALRAQKAKLAEIVRGRLIGQVKVSGRGKQFDQIKPTLAGSGQMAIKDGKLMGINLAAQAVNKVQGIPGIDTLLTPSVVARHPALFKDPNTDLKAASLSFTLQGPRIISHDITVASADYKILGDGWFDMDKNVDLTAHLLLSREFSAELRAEKKNVVYLEDRDGEIDIPVLIRGTLPKPLVVPDIQTLAQRAATHAFESKGEGLLNKFLKKKTGLGGFFGGGSGQPPAGGTGSSPPPPANPLEQLKKLF